LKLLHGDKIHGLKSLREVVCSILELRKEKQIFVEVEGGKVDFFQILSHLIEGEASLFLGA